MGVDLEDFTSDQWAVICLANWLATTDDQVYFKDSGSRFVRVSEHVVEAMNAGRGELRGVVVETEADLIGRTDGDLFVAATAGAALESEQQIMRTGAAAPQVVERQTWPDGSITYVSTSKFPLHGPDGALIGTFGFSRDVTNELAIRQQLADVLSFSPDGISRLDTQLRYLFVNPAAAATMGLPPAQIVGRTQAELGLTAGSVDIWVAALRRVVDTGEPTRLEHSDGEGDGLRFYESHIVAESDVDIITGVLVFTRNITQRKRAELALAEQAVRDPLTGLANRALLLDRLEQSLLRLERLPGIVAVLFLDLDKFKPINDTLGHAAGDALLKQVADRLRNSARRSDTLARFGGDEFVILCDRIAAPEDARTAAERVIREVNRPFAVAGGVVHISASVGIAATSDPLTLASDLVRDADMAMYQAKERGRGGGRYQFFDADVRQHAVNRFETEKELRVALTDGQFRVYYQPLHNLSTGELLGVEALVRWQHPTRGLLVPADFLAVAEQCDIIVSLGEWVLDEACSQLARWNTARTGAPPLTMAVNVSARQLANHSLVNAVAIALQKHQIPPQLLCLEITETALLEEAVSSPEVFAALRALGVRLALDDFGTGYSSLAHLRRFPVDIIKIDQEFVRELSPAGGDLAIVAAITAMAHALGMVTVGEGVETAAQLVHLREIGCDDGQGYLLSRPMPAAELDAILAKAQPQQEEPQDQQA